MSEEKKKVEVKEATKEVEEEVVPKFDTVIVLGLPTTGGGTQVLPNITIKGMESIRQATISDMLRMGQDLATQATIELQTRNYMATLTSVKRAEEELKIAKAKIAANKKPEEKKNGSTEEADKKTAEESKK